MATPDLVDLDRNVLLRNLPLEERERVRRVAILDQVEMRREVYRRGDPIDDVYFPLSAVFSFVAMADEERVVEVATVGYEGMAGLPAFLGATTSVHAAFAQVPGEALRVSAPDLRELLVGNGSLHRQLNRYTQALIVQVAQNVACGRTHSTEERASRWMLTTQDRTGTDTFPLTQEFLAQMLGVRRPTVSLTAGVLQTAGLISYTRGEVTILDRAGLEETACSCYRLIADELHDLLGPDDVPGDRWR